MVSGQVGQKETKQQKAVALFQFIRELNLLKQKSVLNISEYAWHCFIDSFPNDPENIHVYYRDRVEEENAETDSDILVKVHKPEFQRCPPPPSDLKEWLNPGWDDYRLKSSYRQAIERPIKRELLPEPSSEEYRRRVNEEKKTYKEFFDDVPARAAAYTEWLVKRTVWADRQKVLAQTRSLFSDLYTCSIDLERESETLELVVADGFLLDRESPDIDHPILTRRVNLRYDAVDNTIYIEDTAMETELYTALFQDMEGISLTSTSRLQEDLHLNDYHPLDRNDLPDFFKQFIHQLSSESLYSDTGIPDGWETEERFLLYQRPCYILRKRIDGTVNAIKQIIDHVSETGEVPAPISDIVAGGKIDIPEDTGKISVEEQLASVGGESVDILLSKEANKEQLEIARRIERYNAVLVQGPPGTGKTHTIANLLGHFLAQGKSVLVTSHTKKALSVLKEKVVPGLQNLCVSVLEDSNVDMERSIDGITSYMGQTNAFAVKEEMEALGRERETVIRDLAQVRKKLFTIINQECNCIVYNGEDISPSAAAAFVQENNKTLSYIPGSVQLYAPLPLSRTELAELYQSNQLLSSQDEAEMACDLPDPAAVMTPEEVEQHGDLIRSAESCLASTAAQMQWNIQDLCAERKILVEGAFGRLTLDHPDPQAVAQLQTYISSFSKIESWMQHCAVDGKKGGAYRQNWLRMVEQIQETQAHADALVAERFGKDVQINDHSPEFAGAVQKLMEKYSQGGKIGKMTLLFNKSLELALNGATINGQTPQNAEDCQLILNVLRMNTLRKQCATYWNDLIAKYDIPQFDALDPDTPEQIAANYIPLIHRYLDWFNDEYGPLTTYMANAGLPVETIFRHDPLDAELVRTEKILSAIACDLPAFCDVFDAVKTIADTRNELQQVNLILQADGRISSGICNALISAINTGDVPAYQSAYTILQRTYAKISLKQKREDSLLRLATAAPQWAEAIRTRNGIHGEASLPADIEDAWKWKQYAGIIGEIMAEPFSELQKQSLELSKRYRTVTAKYAEKSAWYHLLRRTESDIDMKQALIGWKLTVKKIGKGTGKNAPRYRADARKLMVKCQEAVPAWIMPINKALESLDPRKNKFDIVIIDEASQSDISSLAILYMGKKLIIVGDDKQVSPMAVGTQVDKINALKAMYLDGVIPNPQLYDAKTSIYDIAATTFQPLMLREHFRCAPEIIGFSNWLSYDFKIKPLRDCSNSALLPAVVNYRVADGQRVGKTNPNEVQAIIALMQACMEQAEYAGKTFGVISLLGDEQVKALQAEIYQRLDAQVCSERKILCGNASHFQGDERDVIFLSMVDSPSGNGPLSLMGYGTEDSYRKRYNVAASRARDQLWVVHSLDPANDLKPGDLRRKLIEYALNPSAVQQQDQQIEAQSDSPFETAVARYLTAGGYHLVQQWKVGAYRLDMVAICGNRRMAIECDGERYHSGEEKVREDMERQTILERLGWRFIRIRGSEYFRDPENAMERVIAMLTEAGITPESSGEAQETAERSTELLDRVKRRAHELLYRENAEPSVGSEVIEAALDPKNDVIGRTWETSLPAAVTSTPTVSASPIPMSPTSHQPEPVADPVSVSTPEPKSVAVELPPAAKPSAPTSGTVLPETISRTAPQPKQITPDVPEQSGLFEPTSPPSGETPDDPLIQLLQEMGIQYVDKRHNNGSLWIIGGHELYETVAKAKHLGYVFHFKQEGGRATKNQPAWWTK